MNPRLTTERSEGRLAGWPAALLAGALALFLPGSARAAVVPEPATEILASGEGPELYAEEADFYEWAGGDAPGGANWVLKSNGTQTTGWFTTLRVR